jgi:hypothetical protein
MVIALEKRGKIAALRRVKLVRSQDNYQTRSAKNTDEFRQAF